MFICSYKLKKKIFVKKKKKKIFLKKKKKKINLWQLI